MSGATKTVIATVGFFGVLTIGYLAARTIKSRMLERLKVIQVDTKLIDHIDNEKLL